MIVWHNTPIGAPGMAQLKSCRALIRNGVGFDSVDIAAARQIGIPVCNVPDYGTEEVADHAIALIMALCRQLFPLDAEAKALGWHIKVESRLRRLRELTLGADGLRGELTLMRAARARAALSGEAEVSMETLKSVAPLALRHRLRKDPLDDTDAGIRVERAVSEVFVS